MAKMLDGPVPEGARSVSWPWYHHELGEELTPEARHLLETYAGIARDDVESHVYRIRDKAWGIFPWPCVGEFWFLSFGLSKHPLYWSSVVPRLREGATLLDIGSCLGQDLRRCIFDGAPASNLFATDVFPEYADLSYDLWRDRDRLPGVHYITDDIVADNESFSRGNLMQRLGPGQTEIISITMFLHLFDYQNQLKVATRILRLLSHRPGSLILGSQAGVETPMEQPLKPPFDRTTSGEKRTVFRHSPASFTKLWEEAGIASGVPLRVSAVFQAPDCTASPTPIQVDSGLGPVSSPSRSPSRSTLFKRSSSRGASASASPVSSAGPTPPPPSTSSLSKTSSRIPLIRRRSPLSGKASSPSPPPASNQQTKRLYFSVVRS